MQRSYFKPRTKSRPTSGAGDCGNSREARRKVDSLITDQPHKSELPFTVLPEHSNRDNFNPSDWRKPDANEASSFNEETLICAARAGQEWAFVELCSRYLKRILFMLQRITKNREDAEDALQESMLKAFVHLGEFNQTSTFGTWLTRISINTALMNLRKKRARPEISTDAAVDEKENRFQWEIADRRPNPEEHCIELETHRQLQSAISRLPSRLRPIVEIRRRSEASLREIAEEAGITIAAAKARLWRARKVLRKSIVK
jgi:RNA polymerase sigma factor (sigma-70 family)